MASIPRPRQADGSAVGNRCSAGRLDGRTGVLRGGRPSADGRGFPQRQPEFFPHVSVMSRWEELGLRTGLGHEGWLRAAPHPLSLVA
jgi:hypothetical protein